MEYSTCIYFAYIPVQKEKFCEWSRHSSPINFKYRLRKPAISSRLDDFHWLLKSKHVSIWGPWFNGTADRARRFPPKLQKQIVRSIYSAVESRNTRLSTGLRINILKFIGATLIHARQALLKKEKKGKRNGLKNIEVKRSWIDDSVDISYLPTFSNSKTWDFSVLRVPGFLTTTGPYTKISEDVPWRVTKRPKDFERRSE